MGRLPSFPVEARFEACSVQSRSEASPAEVTRFVPGDAGYPRRLFEIAPAAPALWVFGRLPVPAERMVAIVGSRAASGVGCKKARALASELGRGGCSIVSGGAFGIDAAAHEGALDVGVPTFAVLGCGVDVVYPDRHAALFERIVAAGGLVSEHAPGTPPRRRHFPSRNRIIVALADVVIVVEAALRSGALITARLARAAGRRLLVVPGSAGTDALVISGLAQPVDSAADVEAELSGRTTGTVRPVPSAHTAALLAALGAGANTPAGLARRLGAPLSLVIGLLSEAEIDGFVRRRAGSLYEVTRGD